MHRLSSLALASVSLVQVLAASLHPRFPVPVGAPGWTFFECFEDPRELNLPLLTGPSYADSKSMTIEACAEFCESQPEPYRLMGITEGYICACDNYCEGIFESESGNVCQTPCPGNPSEAGGCGGNDGRLPTASVYQQINSAFITPVLVPSVGLWNGLGCYNDSVSARALQVRVDAGNTTVESCVAACQAQEFTLAGLEYGKECWCGSELENGSHFYTNDMGVDSNAPLHRFEGVYCNMNCEGAPAELCGGPALLDLYNFTGTYPIGAIVVPEAGGWTSRGCYSDLVSSRTLERRVNVEGSMTVELCIPACQEQSFTIAGLEYAQECWCGNHINSPGAPISQSACNQVCVGNSSEVCGGSDALELYF